VSIHADDEFSLRLALETELDDVTPRDGLAELVIARYRKGRRRRFAGVFGLFVVFAGIGVPVGVAATSGGGPAEPVVLRLGSYTLTLPAGYHASDANAAPCAAGPHPREAVAAAASSGICVLMLLTPPGEAPRGAKKVTVGRYQAWLVPRGYAPAGLLIEEGRRALVVGAEGLSQPALVSLVSSGLRTAA
jgi:hypothetical protein